jgi:hypothetical protein
LSFRRRLEVFKKAEEFSQPDAKVGGQASVKDCILLKLTVLKISEDASTKDPF